MIGCREVGDRWSAYVDGELDDVTASALRGHLRVCPACRTQVEDGARLRSALAELAPAEAPPSLWAAVEARLGEEEIGDAQRSGLGLAWERARRALRRHALSMAMGSIAVATVTLTVWRALDHGAVAPAAAALTPADVVPDERPPQPATAPARLDQAPSIPLPVEDDFSARRIASVARADARYRDTIGELEALAADERPRWPEPVRAMFDRRLTALRAASARALAAPGGRGIEPGGKDELYAAYREEIAFLQKAALGELVVARMESP